MSVTALVLAGSRPGGDPFAEGLGVAHKALIEVRAEQPGILRRIDCAEGAWCPLGGALALLSDGADEPLDEVAAELPADFRIG